MHVTHNVNVEAKVGDVDRQFQKAKARFMKGDEYALLAFQAEFPENEYVARLVTAAHHERADGDYRAWLADMNPLGGCA